MGYNRRYSRLAHAWDESKVKRDNAGRFAEKESTSDEDVDAEWNKYYSDKAEADRKLAEAMSRMNDKASIDAAAEAEKQRHIDSAAANRKEFSSVEERNASIEAFINGQNQKYKDELSKAMGEKAADSAQKAADTTNRKVDSIKKSEIEKGKEASDSLLDKIGNFATKAGKSIGNTAKSAASATAKGLSDAGKAIEKLFVTTTKVTTRVVDPKTGKVYSERVITDPDEIKEFQKKRGR